MGKIVITGTGRCGTSFLMHFFTALGLNTGYTLEECEQHLFRSGCDGGIEHSIGTELFEKSDIIKNPEWLYNPYLLTFEIDYIIMPIRNLKNVALSRENVGHNAYGGFWQGAKTMDEQMNIDTKAFYKFMQFAIRNDMKMIFLDFPRIIHDPIYLYDKIGSILPVCLRPWHDSFNEIAKPEKVHI